MNNKMQLFKLENNGNTYELIQDNDRYLVLENGETKFATNVYDRAREEIFERSEVYNEA